MKKFLFTIIILLLLGGAGFFFGWVQFSVPPGAYGVINSKTHGVDHQLVQSGEFRWLWDKLIPTNVRVSVFRLEPVKFPVDFSSSLPSGHVYADFAGINEGFSWDIKAEISFSIDPAKLVQVTSLYHITDQAGLDEHIHDIAQNIRVMIIHTLSSTETEAARLEHLLSGNQDIQLEMEIAGKYPEITGFLFSIQSANFPNFVLYRQVRSLYEEFISEQRSYISSAFGKHAENHIESRLRFDELDRYGELLTKYPVLLDYLTLEKNIKTEQ